MKRKTIIFILSSIVLVCIFITCAAYLIHTDGVAVIYSNGEVIQQIPLDSVTEPYEISVEKDGHHNIILVESGKISMKSADCPDGLCVAQGKISNSTYPIVCLPNNVIIKIEGEAPNNEKPDAVSR